MSASELNFVIRKDNSWPLTNKSNNVITTGRPYYIELNNHIFGPSDLHLMRTIDKINIFMLSSNSLKLPVELPEKISGNLINFFVSIPSNIAFDCHKFIAYIFDKYNPSNLNAITSENWSLENFEQNRLIPGTAIYLSKKGVGKHSALYLGYEQYISLFGSGGNIMVANLLEMEKLFDVEDIQILQPKE